MSAHPSITKAEAYRLRRDGLIKGAMPPRLPDDVLREDLAELIETFNATTEPAERVALMGRIKSVRALLGITSSLTLKQGPH